MKDLNVIAVSGTVIKDAECKVFNDKTFTTFSIACNDDYKKYGTEEWINRAYFFNVVLGYEKALEKGTRVIVKGKLTTKQVEKDGKKNTYYTINAETLVVERKKEENKQKEATNIVEDDEDIPF